MAGIQKINRLPGFRIGLNPVRNDNLRIFQIPHKWGYSLKILHERTIVSAAGVKILLSDLKKIVQIVRSAAGHFAVLLQMLLDQFALPLGIHAVFFPAEK